MRRALCWISLLIVALFSESTLVLGQRPDSPGRSSQRDPAATISRQTKAIRANPRNAVAYFKRAHAYLDEQNFEMVIDDTTQAIALKKLKPATLADAFCLRATARMATNDFENALTDCNHAISVQPNHALAYSTRARARALDGDWAGVFADCNKSISLNSSSSLPYYTRGHANVRRGNYEQAIADWRQAIRLHPRFKPELEPLIQNARMNIGAQKPSAPPPVIAAEPPVAAFSEAVDESEESSEMPAQSTAAELASTGPGSLGFDRFKTGPAPAEMLAAHGGRIVVAEGNAIIGNAGPEMVLPSGRSRVFMVNAGPVTSVSFEFDPPITKFNLTRIGVIKGASVPTWKMEALDRDHSVLDSVGETHGLYQEPRKFFVQGDGIAVVRLSTDNRFGSGTWATYNSLPVAEFEIEREISSTASASTPEMAETPPPIAATSPVIAAATPRPGWREGAPTPPPVPELHPGRKAPAATPFISATISPPAVAAVTPSPGQREGEPTPPPVPGLHPGKKGAAATPSISATISPPAVAAVTPSPGRRESAPTPSPVPGLHPGKKTAAATPSISPAVKPPAVAGAKPPPVLPTATAPPAKTATPQVVAALTPKPTAPPPSSPSAAPKKPPASPVSSPAVAKGPTIDSSAGKKPGSAKLPPDSRKPEAVIAAAQKTSAPPPAGGHDEPIANGAFIVQRPDSWQVAEKSDDTAMFVSQEVPNFAVLFEWSPSQAEGMLDGQRAGAERLPDAKVGTATAQRFAWIEAPDPDRREALQVSWGTGEGMMQATAIAAPLVWEKHGDKVFALLNGRPGQRTAPTPKPTETPEPVVSPTPTPVSATTPTPSPTEAPKIPLIIASVVKEGTPASSGGELENVAMAESGWNIRHDQSWQVSDSGSSYAVLSATESPDLTASIEWSDAKGRSLDQVANENAVKLRGRYAAVESLPKRTIAGAPAQQIAWLTGSGAEKREMLQVDWIDGATLFRATISAPPETWKKNGPQILQLLEDINKGG